MGKLDQSGNSSFNVPLLTPQGVVLIAEDDPDDAKLIERAVIQILPNPIHFAKDGLGVLAYLRGDGDFADRSRFSYPVLLLLDLRMPNLNGFDVLRWLQARKQTQSFPTIVLSVSGRVAEIAEAYRLGAHSFLTKPPVAAQLLTAVEKWTIQLKPGIKNA